jgi:hypothetical protein
VAVSQPLTASRRRSRRWPGWVRRGSKLLVNFRSASPRFTGCCGQVGRWPWRHITKAVDRLGVGSHNTGAGATDHSRHGLCARCSTSIRRHCDCAATELSRQTIYRTERDPVAAEAVLAAEGPLIASPSAGYCRYIRINPAKLHD